MPADKQHIHIVWLKRDLRLEDNEAIYNALKTKKRVVLLYVFEDILINDSHYSLRHFNFIKESLVDLNLRLKNHNTKVLAVKGSVLEVLNTLSKIYHINGLHSHQETGLNTTFKRDKDVALWCKNHKISWYETINNGVIRGLSNRQTWFDDWNHYMQQELFAFYPKESQLLSIAEIERLQKNFEKSHLEITYDSNFQKGGRTTAIKYANSFFSDRHKAYMYHISKPEASRKSCSRLSPYLAWGNLSVREVFQQGKKVKKTSLDKKHLMAFLSRLRWQAHFIQKFEMECSMEFKSVNKGYHNLNKKVKPKLQEAWRLGNTGFPLVDAAMRCLNTTGYVNFRLRALLVSFFTHALWQPWQDATEHLAKQFLDFEPGIHFPQIQMQAAETGINNIRIYNPLTNALNHDSEAIFIKKWVPELRALDTPFALNPSSLTALEVELYNFKLGEHYPHPIVDIKTTRKKAADILFNMRNNSLVKEESKRILARHTLSNRKIMLIPND